jgi:hypothetical protein
MNVPKPMTHTPVKQQKRMVSRGRQRHRDTPVKLEAGYWILDESDGGFSDL